jgi:hypothetical protein
LLIHNVVLICVAIRSILPGHVVVETRVLSWYYMLFCCFIGVKLNGAGDISMSQNDAISFGYAIALLILVEYCNFKGYAHLVGAQKHASFTKVGDNLLTSYELASMPKFQAGTTSLLAKHLTRKVWNELKDKKDYYDCRFKQCIFSGCKVVDGPIGVYAGSHLSYTAFAPLFDPIIEEIHNYSAKDEHKTIMSTN